MQRDHCSGQRRHRLGHPLRRQDEVESGQTEGENDEHIIELAGDPLEPAADETRVMAVGLGNCIPTLRLRRISRCTANLVPKPPVDCDRPGRTRA